MLTMTYHARSRMHERRVGMDQLARAFCGVRYYHKPTRREVWTAQIGRRILAVVVDPAEGVVVTMYWTNRSHIKSQFSRWQKRRH